MIQLMIIADDFTGALDTGVQFAAWGAVVRVVTDVKYEYGNLDPLVQILVMDAETRHLSEQEAYEVVYEAARNAKKHQIPYIYKKTDSALRGNIGSELKALKDAMGVNMLPFIPAFPQMGRTTRHGIHFIDGKPVRESVFGKDPFEPVECSYVPDIIHRQTDAEVIVAERKWGVSLSERDAIVVFDADGYEDILVIAKKLDQMGLLKVTAGCAGFAASLPKLLGLTGEERRQPDFKSGLLVVCGSVNPITQKQLDEAERKGFIRISLTPKQKLTQQYWSGKEGQEDLKKIYKICLENQRCIIDTNDKPGTKETEAYGMDRGLPLEKIREVIAENLGMLLKGLIDRKLHKTLLITGGDTLLGFMESMEIREMEPICEMAPGAVLSEFYTREAGYQIISKSGGFGEEDLLVKLAEKIERRKSSC